MSLLAIGWRRVARLGCWLALGLLVSCGGSTQVQTYIPTRVLVFGDENNVIEADGRKYTVNGLQADLVTPDCTVNQLWVQILAGHYGLVFPQCPGGVLAPASRIYAANGARVANIAAQITQAGPLSASDLSTFFVGSNDILAIYGQYPGKNEATLKGEVEAQAVALAVQVHSIVDLGGKVVFATLPDLGYSPFAVNEEAAFPGTGRAALLSVLTKAFNTKLRTSISNANLATFIDGHQGVQVLADELIVSIRKTIDTAPSTSTYLNYSVAICANSTPPASPLDCNSGNLLPAATAAGGTAFNHLWADDRHLSPGGHSAFGGLAVTRTNANPL